MTSLAQKQHLVSKTATKKNGAAVTFTLTVPGTYNDAADTFTDAADTTVVGTAERVPGNPERYKALELVETEAPTLKFTPDTFGEVPPLNASVSFGGTTYIVRDVDPWAPSGTAISARVIVSR